MNEEQNSNSALIPALCCPFCGGEAELREENGRHGYGEYERTLVFHVVRCRKCNSHGTRYEQKPLIEFTNYTVSDFRNNPILRAKVENDYDAYKVQTKEMAISAWNRRTDAIQEIDI
jgi:hypothetical protein